MTKSHPGTGSSGATPPPPGFLISPKVGLVGFLVMLGLAGVAYVALGFFAGSDAPNPETPDGSALVGGVPVGGLKPTIEYIDDGQLAAIDPEGTSRELQAELIHWFLAMDRKPISDREEVDEPEWAARILEEGVRRRMDRLPERVFGSLDNIPSVIDEPGPYRGTLVSVWGRVESVAQAKLRLPKGDRAVSRLRLLDHAGVAWVATVVAPVSDSVKVGSWVKIPGVFAKLWPNGDRPALHVFATRAPIGSFAPVSYDAPRVEWLEQVSDATPDGSTALEDVPFYGMLNYVRSLGIDGYRAARDNGSLEVADLTGTQGSKPLLDAPQNWRFRAVRLRAAPIHKEFVVDRSLGENPGNIDFIYRGYLVDDQNHPVLFMSPFPLEAFDFAGARMVEIEGFFFKRRMVQGTNGKRYYLPILVGVDITPIEIGPVGSATDPKIVLAVAGSASMLMLLAFVFMVRRTKRSDEAVRRRNVRRHHARRDSDAAGRGGVDDVSESVSEESP